MKKVFCVVAAVACAAVLLGCPPTAEAPGGFEAQDFTQINLNGFDPVDNEQDRNDYAWAMEYFQPDGKAAGHVYVGTGNDMTGLMFQGMASMMGGAELGDVSVSPPEIRRYRPDVFPYAWERVLDYRDVESEGEFTTIGFRFLKAYRAQSDGVNRLYAATFGEQATLWWTETGEPNSWSVVWTTGETGSVRWMTEHNGLLYLCLANDAPTGVRIGKIYATDGATFWPIVEDGFGDPGNTAIMSLVSWNGWLYAGTQNQETGYEIWKLEGPDKQAPVCIVANGGPSKWNESAISPCIFKDKLYWGNMIYMNTNMMHMKGSDIIRIDANDQWETVVGKCGISCYDSGFNHWLNTYIWWMAEHDGWLYASTYDEVSSFTGMGQSIGRFLEGYVDTTKRDATCLDKIGKGGADLYKTQDGVTWYPVTLDGLGDVGNYGIRTMLTVGNEFYLGTANPFDGLEIWKAETLVGAL